MDYQKAIYDQLRQLNKTLRELTEANKRPDLFLSVSELAKKFNLCRATIYKCFPLREVNGKLGMLESEAVAYRNGTLKY